MTRFAAIDFETANNARDSACAQIVIAAQAAGWCFGS